LVDVIAISSNEAIAVSDAQVLRTTDGGNTWEDISPSDHPQVDGVFFLDGSHGWLASDVGGTLDVYVTTDGGSTWIHSSLAGSYSDGDGGASWDFLTELTGWLAVRLPSSAAFARDVIYRTTDGGTSWDMFGVAPLDGPIAFVSETSGWGTGGAEASALYQTVDEGKSWGEQSLPRPNGYSGEDASFGTPVFFDTSTGVLEEFLTGSQQAAVDVLTTHDAGNNWVTSTPLGLSGDLAAGAIPPLSALPDRIAIATDDGLAISTDQGASWTTLSPNISLSGARQLDFVTDADGWLLTASSSCAGFKTDCTTSTVVYHTSDGGATWTVESP